VNQQKYVDFMENRNISVLLGVGPAGSGKTLFACNSAVKELKAGLVDRIIITRPIFSVDEELGFLPGSLESKMNPWTRPVFDVLSDFYSVSQINSMVNNGIIEISPLAFMRGRTLDNAFVILDEAQNTTHSQMKMFLTRMGKNAKFIITGDPGQVDLPRRTISGLKEAILVLKDIEGIGIIYLDDKDIVRHRLVKKVIDAYKSIENND
jgi:phosphate starvation-inducible PhoH-like protein